VRALPPTFNPRSSFRVLTKFYDTLCPDGLGQRYGSPAAHPVSRSQIVILNQLPISRSVLGHASSEIESPPFTKLESLLASRFENRAPLILSCYLRAAEDEAKGVNSFSP
jgi:hypothetical protein